MNFGKWIVVAFILFAVFIATLVTVCVKQDISLVTKEYYQEELKFQEQIDRRRNTDALAELPVISVEKGVLTLNYALLPEVEKGQIKLFRPSDPDLDQIFEIRSSSATSKEFAIFNPHPGLYRAQMSWSQNDKEYYFERIIIL